VCDLNLDQLDDVALSSDNAMNKAGTAANAGRVDLLFGRSSWPGVLDLQTQSDVAIRGAETLDDLGAGLACADVHGDGSSDLMVDMQLGAGPNNSRTNAAEVHIFRGRTIWPVEIDLATSSSDTIILGREPGDQIGRYEGIAVGSLDLDAGPDLALGVRLGDSVSNGVSAAGEVKLLELGPEPPALVDTRTVSMATVYGADASDVMCQSTQLGDSTAIAVPIWPVPPILELAPGTRATRRAKRRCSSGRSRRDKLGRSARINTTSAATVPPRMSS
jgi:hypothetical protein